LWSGIVEPGTEPRAGRGCIRICGDALYRDGAQARSSTLAVGHRIFVLCVDDRRPLYTALQTDASAGIAGFAISASAEAVMLARRALSATPWFGNGLGRSDYSPHIPGFWNAADCRPPSTAVVIATEWGQPALLLLAGFATQLFAFAFREPYEGP